MKYLKDIKDWKEMKNQVVCGDCLELMPLIADKSVDMILCDLPYGTTACKWDTIIPFDTLWEQYKRIIKDNGAIVLTASQPFTSALVMSNVKMFKYEWIWNKSHPSGFALAKKIPMKYHENVVVFYKNPPTYNYQLTEGKENHWKERKETKMHGTEKIIAKVTNSSGNMKYPSSVQKINSVDRTKILHPTQKPVALFEYLIKTYTNEGDLVLDNCAGSFTTAVACNNLKRDWVCIEKEADYCKVGEERLRQEVMF